MKKILIGILALLIVVLLVWFFLMRSSGSKTTSTPQSNAPVQTSQTPVDQLEIPLAPVTQEQQTVQKNRNMTAFSMQFTERYGSYSNESDFQNLKDLLPSMTDAMRRKAEAVIENGMSTDVFYGITTKALAAKVETSTTASATMLVSTRRSEKTGTSPERIFNQDIRLHLVKSDDQWLVDSAEWQPESK